MKSENITEPEPYSFFLLKRKSSAPAHWFKKKSFHSHVVRTISIWLPVSRSLGWIKYSSKTSQPSVSYKNTKCPKMFSLCVRITINTQVYDYHGQLKALKMNLRRISISKLHNINTFILLLLHILNQAKIDAAKQSTVATATTDTRELFRAELGIRTGL
jgi:hypothetical protein